MQKDVRQPRVDVVRRTRKARELNRGEHTQPTSHAQPRHGVEDSEYRGQTRRLRDGRTGGEGAERGVYVALAEEFRGFACASE